MLALEYLPTARSKKWRRSSLRMHNEGRSIMETSAAALKEERGWHAYRIIED